MAWERLYSADDLLRSLQIGQNADGRLEAIGVAPDDTLWHTWQSSPGNWVGYWDRFYSADDKLVDLRVARNRDGRLEVIGIAPGETVWHTWQSSPGEWIGYWDHFYSDEDKLRSLRIGQNADGRLEAFGVASDDSVWHTWQSSPGDWVGSWECFYSDGDRLLNLEVGRNTDGRLEAIGVAPGESLWRTWQSSAGNWVGYWESFYSTDDRLRGLQIGQNVDGRLEAIGVASGDSVWRTWQSSPGNWIGYWESFYSVEDRLLDLRIARNQDGRLEAIGVAPDGSLWYTWQSSPGNWVWWWDRLDSTEDGLLSLEVAQNSDGRIEALGIVSGYGVWHDVQASSGQWVGSKHFGPGNWPPASLRPYADTSPFNTPIPLNPPVHPDSDAIIQRVMGDLAAIKQPANFIINVDGNSGEPTYYAQLDDPEYTLQSTLSDEVQGQDKGWGVCPLDGLKLRIPRGAKVEGGIPAPVSTPSTYLGNPDAHLTVLDQTTGWEYDLWQVHRSPIFPEDGNVLKFSWGGRTRIEGDGLASDELKTDPKTGQPVPRAKLGQAVAARFGSLAGRIRAEEMLAGEINHVLCIVVKCVNQGPPVPPARGQGLACPNSANAPSMGSRIQLNLTHEQIESLGRDHQVPRWKLTLMHAMSKYGMIISDTGTDFYFSLETEAGSQYTSVGRFEDRWLKFAVENGFFHKAQGQEPSYPPEHYVGTFGKLEHGMDWDQQVWRHLRVIAPM